MIIDILSQNKCFVSIVELPPLLQKRKLIYSFPDFSRIVKYLTPKVIKVFEDKLKEIGKYFLQNQFSLNLK